jgi:AmmeMemoRadiSam system radical SAM enzyme
MTASNAICARAFANSMKVSAPFALCAPGKTTYGRSSGFCIDPVEKKALNHFLPGTPVLSFGTSGCNLGCKFCQNWDISKAQEFDVLAECASPEDIARTAEQLGCPSVAYTYNDPTIFMNTLWTRRSPAMNAVSRASR